MRQLSPANQRTWLAYRSDLRVRQIQPRTIENYFESLLDADRALEMPLVDATRADLKLYLGDCTERLADSTVHMRWLVLKIFYKWMVAEELIAKSPMDGISEPQVKDNPPRIIRDEDLVKLLKACAGTALRDRRDLAIIRLMLEAGGPRRAEIITLKLEDVDLDNELILIHGKGGKTRMLPYGARTAQALNRYLIARAKHKNADDEALWLGRFGPLSIYSLGQILESRCEQAGIERIKPHDLRHKSADVAMSSGISDLDMQTLYGWSSGRMLAVYARSNRVARAIKSARNLKLGDRL